MLHRLFALLIAVLCFSGGFFSQGCNADVSICTQGVAGPFLFDKASFGPPADYADPVGCSTGSFGNNTGFGFIILYITESGPLNLLVSGDSGYGFIDVIVYIIPEGAEPCAAVLNSSNEIGCNYASDMVGCTQFGMDFPCTSSVPAPEVVAGQTIMIIAHDYSDSNDSFTLQLGPNGAQTGVPDATITPVTTTACLDGAAFQLQASNMGGNWSGSGVSANGLFDPSLAGPGIHTINYEIGSEPCRSAASTTIAVQDCSLPVCSVSIKPPGNVCSGAPFDLEASEVSGVIAYSWSGEGFSSALRNPQNIGMYHEPGNYHFIVTATTNEAVCVAATTVTILPLPAISAGSDKSLCSGDTLILSGSGGISYLWSNGVTDNQAFVPAETQTYTLNGIDGNGCSASDQVNITVIPLPEISFTQDVTNGCSPLTVNFQQTVPGGTDFTWMIGGEEFKEDNPGKTFTGSGNCFPVSLTASVNGCSNTLTREDHICLHVLPEANFSFSESKDASFTRKVRFTNHSESAKAFVWDFGDQSPFSDEAEPEHIYETLETGSFDVTLYAYSEAGCVDSVSRAFQASEELIFYIPNAFTPDGNEINNVFLPVFTTGFVTESYHLSIYNRWGELMFESYDHAIGWDGSYKQRMAETGVYTWHIEFITSGENFSRQLSGKVSLLR